MKGKTRKYFLMATVAIIWGLIATQFYTGVPENNYFTSNINSIDDFKPRKVLSQDTFTIEVDYKDPFLKGMKKKVSRIKSLPKKVIKPEKIVQFPSIKYNGLILPKSGATSNVFLVVINGKLELFNIGKTIDDCTLHRGNQNEIVINYKGAEKTIKKQ